MAKEENDFLKTNGGRITAALLVLGLIVGIVYLVKANLGASKAAQLANTQTFVCSKTGKSFSVTLEVGMKFPVHSPYSGEDTGYPAEMCYWTADGQVKDKPDPVLLNSWVGKPDPTFCPICGRLVVHRNPKPSPGSNPPPTQAEYQQRH